MTITIDNSILQKAALQFGNGAALIQPLGKGLIHQTFSVDFSESAPIVLQCINQETFKQPENIIHNYQLLQDTLEREGNSIPRLLKTTGGKYFWVDPQGNFWRATQFIPNSYAPDFPKDAGEVYAAGKCFAAFTRALEELDTGQFEIIIPHFHDLPYRYQQLEDTILTAPINRLLKATHVISELRNRKSLVEFYRTVQSNPLKYPTRLMHHDCKISNILFEKTTGQALCPVDLDTVMPGKFFSDIGDMIRTMACCVDENSTAWEKIDVNETAYRALVKGYLEGMGISLTTEEQAHIHDAGLLLTYMQSIRFVSDFLNNDSYYKTTYPEQNLNRALNQLILLEKLEAFSNK